MDLSTKINLIDNNHRHVICHDACVRFDIGRMKTAVAIAIISCVWLSMNADGIKASAEAANPGITMFWRNCAPGNIFRQGEAIKMEIDVCASSTVDMPLNLDYSVKDYYGQEVGKGRKSCEFKGGNVKRIEFDALPRSYAQTGFFIITAALSDSNGLIKKEEGSFGVVKPFEPADNSIFGMHYAPNNPEYLDLIDALSAIGVKQMDMMVCWFAYQPESKSGVNWNGVEGWGNLDKAMERAIAHNMKIVGEIGFCPKWASSGNKTDWWNDRPKNPSDLGDFAFLAAARYKGKACGWTWGGESDLWLKNPVLREWGGDDPLAKFANTYKAVADGAKRANPECKMRGVDVSGVDCMKEPALSFADKIMNSLKDDIDIFSIHPYYSACMFQKGIVADPPEKKWPELFTTAKALMKKYGKNSKLDIGEVGWCVHKDSISPLAGNENLKGLANTVVKAYTIGIASDVEALMWYRDRQGAYQNGCMDFGLWSASVTGRFQPYPSALAYASAARLLNGASDGKELKSSATLKCYSFSQGKDSVAVLWAVSGAGDIRLSGKRGNLRVYDIMGNAKKTVSENGRIIVHVSGAPVFIKAEDVERERLDEMIESGDTSFPKLGADAYLSDISNVSVAIISHSNKSLTGTVTPIPGNSITPTCFTVTPGEQRTVKYTNPAPKSMLQEIALRVEAEGGIKIDIRKDIDLLPCLKVKRPIQVDGDLSDWEGVEPIKLGREHIKPCDAIVHGLWKDERDLSSAIYLAWDEDNLYFAAKVTEATHENRYQGRESWKGDAIQIGINPGGDAIDPKVTMRFPGYGDGDCEYTLALMQEGTRLHRGFPSSGGNNDNVKLDIRRGGDETRYEMAIPFKAMPEMTAKHGGIFGFNVSVSKGDASKGGQYVQTLTDGIYGGKNPALFRKFVLLPLENPKHEDAGSNGKDMEIHR